MNEQIEFSSGHKAVPNGVGDYDLICPVHGARGFLPYMIARTLSADSVCPVCKQAFGGQAEKIIIIGTVIIELLVRYHSDIWVCDGTIDYYFPEVQLITPMNKRVSKLWADGVLLAPEFYLAMTGIILLRDFPVTAYGGRLPKFTAELLPAE